MPGSANKAFGQLPTDFSTLPDVSFVIPNLCHDMQGTGFSPCPALTTQLITPGDTWLHDNLGQLFTYAASHNTLVIVTWDQGSGSTPSDHIPTVF